MYMYFNYFSYFCVSTCVVHYINMYHLMLYYSCGVFIDFSLFLMCILTVFLQIAQLQASYEKSVAEQEELTKNINHADTGQA